ncbi:MFS transporter [Massilia endophytica]|uniref:MFS transporter n=1 Tax=Massilia endophytica TaxID=2899220 RepID=UPI001E2F2788|nr:MFS transporter [Massilia endophytica]UGQ45766.1 MFS transporter [Massilia endophytica]
MSAVLPATTSTVRAARWAVSTVFFLNGAGVGLWAAHVPVVQARAGIDTGVLGLMLLTIAAGAMSAMPLAGWLSARWGTRSVMLCSGLAFAVMTAVLTALSAVPLLFTAAFFFGASNGIMDVSMNANASEVETARGEPTMSSFHGFFSLGGLAGAALGGLLIGLGYGDGSGTLATSMITVAGLALVAPRVLVVPPHTGASHFALPRGPALFLGLLALLCMAVEGALVDWSALLLTERTGVDAATAAMGYSAFSIAMAACRFAGDGLVLRFGAQRMMAVGGLAMFLGLALAAASPWFILSSAGFALIGLGAANVVPLIFAAATRLPGMSAGGGLATAATVGYTGLLMGPVAIGWVAAHSNIAVALGGLSLAGLVIAFSTGAVKKTAQ